LGSIGAAQNSRLAPVKINAVLVRGINDDEVEAFAAFARERGVIMRFIEYMPLDADRHWNRGLVVLPPKSIAGFMLSGRCSKSRTSAAKQPASTVLQMARRGDRPDCSGDAAFLRTLFAHPADRGRQAAQPACFSKEDHALRGLLREGASDEDLVAYVSSVVMEKEEGHRIK